MRSLALFALAVLVSLPALAADFPVLRGDQQAVIVYEAVAKDETVKAYQDLAAYLQKSTGKTFSVVSDSDFTPGSALPIYVGRCNPVKQALRHDLARLDRDGYIVAVEPSRVMLVGPKPWSTYWAVCQFLEDYAGVRWLIPGPLGEDITHSASLTVPPCKRVYTPAMLSRLWSGAHYGGDWNLRQRIYARYNFHHNLINIFDVSKYWATHPEYFPIHGTERYKPGGKDDHAWQPCMGIDATVQVAADAAREAFRQDPNLESFSFGMNDGQGWCECPKCKAIDKPVGEWHGFSGDKSVLFYTWLNKVAANLERDYPDKMLGCLAYSSAILPPPGMKLHRNIIPYFTSNRADYFDPKFRAQDQQLMRWWAQHANQMGIYDYAYGVGFAVPRIYNHLFQDAVKFAAANKVRGFYAEVYPNWGLDGPKLYTMARIVWDPNVNVDAVTADWNERMFHEAAAPMKQYFATAEDAWRRQKGSGAWAYRLAADPAQFLVFPPAVMDEMTRCLDEAAGLAKDDLVKQRIQFFRKTWELTRLLAGNYWAGRQVQDLIERKASVEEVARAMREMADRMANLDVDTYFQKTFANDPIAYFPPLAGWFTPLKGGAATNAIRYFASAVANEAVTLASNDKTLSGAAIREHVNRRCSEIFGADGSEQYRATVARMRDMALKIGTAARVQEPLKVDGALDELVWQKADVLSNFIIWGGTGPAANETRVRLAHDGKDLYIGLECLQDTSKLVCQSPARDGSTWKDDSVEIFINKDMNTSTYAQLIVNARGAFFDQYGNEATQSYAERLAHNFNASWAAQVQPDRWTAEVRVPLAELGVNPAQVPLVRMNFVRNVCSAPETAISAWFSSLRAHSDPLSRGWILLEQ
ncbi:MAG TPA: DUF4838 domain-containing protein [Chloroflexota bacterium]|nr:DUF4838 domain-containing protein [Chloroflexota bacterium]